MLKGGWWWKSCGRGLNGVYLTNPQDLAARQGKLKPDKIMNIGTGTQVMPSSNLQLKKLRLCGNCLARNYFVVISIATA